MTVSGITQRPETVYHDGPPRPPAPVDHQPPGPTPQQDPAIAGIGLPSHRPTRDIARALRDAAKSLEDQGGKAVIAARTLAWRGWPTATMGDGTGSRTTSELTSVERAAHVDHDDLRPGDYDGADRDLATMLVLADQLATKLVATITDLLAHAQDLDPVPAGTGACECCGTFCRPKDGEDHNRLKTGFCPSCYKAWQRAKADAPPTGVNKTDWIHGRRHQLFEGARGACDRCHRPWTDELAAVGL